VSVLPDVGVVSFARGVPSPDMFALEQLAECARLAVEKHGRIALNYGPPGGYAPLREWLARRHQASAEQVIVTPGSLIGLNLVVRRVVGAGGAAVVEAPTYDRMLHSLRDLGAEVLMVDRGDDGLDLERLTEHVTRRDRPRLLYVLPTFHNPTGRTLGRAARERLADLAVEHNLVVFEDDPYGLLRIDGEPQPYVHELLRERGRDDLAIFASSFSKTVAPGLRVGYLILPAHLVGPVEELAMNTYVSPPLLPQAQLLEFLEAGHLDPHLAFLASFLGSRRDALLAGFDERMPPGARWTRPDGGYFLWLTLPGRLDGTEVESAAREQGVTFVPGTGFFADGSGRDTARISFSYPSVDEVREGAARLSAVVRTAAACA
jgi:DNA-binding transcriptional MocR family regulator